MSTSVVKQAMLNAFGHVIDVGVFGHGVEVMKHVQGREREKILHLSSNTRRMQVLPDVP